MNEVLDNYGSFMKSLLAAFFGAGITFIEELTLVVRLLIAIVTVMYIVWKFYTEYRKFVWRKNDRRDGINRGYDQKDK